MRAPAAYATSPTSWHCTACSRKGTRWTLIGAVRARALGRVLAFLESEEDHRV